MKLLLVQPSLPHAKNYYSNYPIGLAYIGAEVLASGHEVRLIDLAIESLDVYIEVIRDFKPDVIGISIVTNTLTESIKLLKITRDSENVIVICGGIHPTLFPEEMLNLGFNYVILGEAEFSVTQFMNKLSNGDNLYDTDGLCWIDQNKTFHKNPPKLPPKNSLRFPARSLIQLAKYKVHSIMGSRGCQFHCDYCTPVFGEGLRVRDIPNVLDEIEIVNSLRPPSEILFTDDILLGSSHKALNLCLNMIKKGLNINWTTQMRADIMSERLVDAMYSAGCSILYFGIESGSQKVLERINKKMNLERAASGVKLAVNQGITVKCSFIIGLPGSYDEQLSAIDFINKTRPNSVSFHMLVPYPGTLIFKERDRLGIRIRQVDDWDSYQFYVPTKNIEYEYLPDEELFKLLKELRLGLESIGYTSGHLSNYPQDPSSLHMYSLPIPE